VAERGRGRAHHRFSLNPPVRSLHMASFRLSLPRWRLPPPACPPSRMPRRTDARNTSVEVEGEGADAHRAHHTLRPHPA
jgi:hypothetical protein